MGFLENAKDSEQPIQTANILKFKKGLKKREEKKGFKDKDLRDR